MQFPGETRPFRRARSAPELMQQIYVVNRRTHLANKVLHKTEFFQFVSLPARVEQENTASPFAAEQKRNCHYRFERLDLAQTRQRFRRRRRKLIAIPA